MEEAIIKVHHALTNYIPAEVRPDVTKLIEGTRKDFASPRFSEWKGHQFSTPSNADKVEWQYSNWDPTENDVLVATYAKTGTTWTTKLVKHLIYQHDKDLLKMALTVTPMQGYLEFGIPLSFEVLEKLPWKRKIWATHLPATLINMKRLEENRTKIIYVVRNPKDQVVSHFHFTKSNPFFQKDSIQQPYPKDFNEFFEAAVNGKLPSGGGLSYPDHILTWHPYLKKENVLFITFEDLKRDTAKEVRRIANFLAVERSNDEINQILEETSFQNLQKKPSKLEESIKMFRKGEIGDWKNYLTVAQSEIMDQKFNEKMSGIDINFVYE
ncbi:sulfotransferase 1C2-like [Clavelina lepadiformis]|uniref:Sulfotransferase n=1 Tax=Clavelina lepadiformis TaxID=159417 RepID=A0ABP0FQ28_CLALP